MKERRESVSTRTTVRHSIQKELKGRKRGTQPFTGRGYTVYIASREVRLRKQRDFGEPRSFKLSSFIAYQKRGGEEP